MEFSEKIVIFEGLAYFAKYMPRNVSVNAVVNALKCLWRGTQYLTPNEEVDRIMACCKLAHFSLRKELDILLPYLKTSSTTWHSEPIESLQSNSAWHFYQSYMTLPQNKREYLVVRDTERKTVLTLVAFQDHAFKTIADFKKFRPDYSSCDRVFINCWTNQITHLKNQTLPILNDALENQIGQNLANREQERQQRQSEDSQQPEPSNDQELREEPRRIQPRSVENPRNRENERSVLEIEESISRQPSPIQETSATAISRLHQHQYEEEKKDHNRMDASFIQKNSEIELFLCPACLEEKPIDMSVCETGCQHLVCAPCYNKWSEETGIPSCPECRRVDLNYAIPTRRIRDGQRSRSSSRTRQQQQSDVEQQQPSQQIQQERIRQQQQEQQPIRQQQQEQPPIRQQQQQQQQPIQQQQQQQPIRQQQQIQQPSARQPNQPNDEQIQQQQQRIVRPPLSFRRPDGRAETGWESSCRCLAYEPLLCDNCLHPYVCPRDRNHHITYTRSAINNVYGTCGTCTSAKVAEDCWKFCETKYKRPCVSKNWMNEPLPPVQNSIP